MLPPQRTPRLQESPIQSQAVVLFEDSGMLGSRIEGREPHANAPKIGSSPLECQKGSKESAMLRGSVGMFKPSASDKVRRSPGKVLLQIM